MKHSLIEIDRIKREEEVEDNSWVLARIKK